MKILGSLNRPPGKSHQPSHGSTGEYPEANSEFTPENQWLEDEFPFGSKGLFSHAFTRESSCIFGAKKYCEVSDWTCKRDIQKVFFRKLELIIPIIANMSWKMKGFLKIPRPQNVRILVVTVFL